MAIKLSGKTTSGLSNVAGYRTRDSDGAVWSTAGTPGFQVFSAGSIIDYDIAAAERGSTGDYLFTDPADTVPGRYQLIAKAGASLTVADVANNTFWEDPAGPQQANAIQLASQAITAAAPVTFPADPAGLAGLASAHGAGAWATATGFSTLDAAGIRTSVGLATANLDTQLTDLPTNAELATALGTADDATLAQIALVKAKTDLIPASPASVGSAMTLDFTQAVPTSNTAQTLGDALNAARAQGFGKWTKVGTALTLYAADGTTVVKIFTLDNASVPTSRA